MERFGWKAKKEKEQLFILRLQMVNLQIIGTQTTVQDYVIISNQDYAKIVANTELYDASQKSQVKCEK